MTALRSILVWFLMWLSLLILGPPYIILCLFDPGGVWTYPVQVLWLRLCLFFAGVRVDLRGKEKLGRRESFVLMPNHRSYFDIPAVECSIFPHQLRFVAKKELGRIPLLGMAMRYGGHIMIERDNREKAIRALGEFAKNFNGRFSIVVFPEGTRSPNLELLRFKRGGFYLARELGARIVPISISGSQHILGRSGLSLRPGTIRIQIHDPIDPAAIPNNDELAAVVRERIESAIDRQAPAGNSQPLTPAGT